MDEFIEYFSELRDNIEKQNEFCSGAIRQDKRLFKILDSNVKTYNTIYKYLYDVINYPNMDNHQKYTKLKDLHFYSDDPTDLISKYRSSIALKVYDKFEEGSFIRDFMIFTFAIKSDVELEKSAEFLTDVLPEDILSFYYDFLRDAYKEASILNPIYGLYVFYSDKEFLYKYINLISNLSESSKLRLNVIDQDKNNYINKRRIHDCQKGSLLNEALIGALYLKLCEIDLEDVNGYEKIVEKILSEYEKLLEYLQIPNSPTKEEWDKLNKLLNTLSEEEKKEILRCYGNISDEIETYEQDETQKGIKMVIQNSQGYDVERTVKQRVGQSTFRKKLISQFDNCKCRLEHCKINKIEFLRASHILEWSNSDETQKTDPNNGLLLCPVHDFLFDAHLITFDNDGKIIISRNVQREFYSEFNIDESNKITVLEENKQYLEEHRNKFYKNEE